MEEILRKNIKFLLTSLKNSSINLDIFGSVFKKKDLSNFQKKYNIRIAYKKIFQIIKCQIFTTNIKYMFQLLIMGNPKTILEAMALWLFSFARNVQGCKSVIKHEQNGFLVKDELHLENLINQNISKNSDKIKKNAIYSIRSKNDLNIITNKGCKILETVKK